MKTMDLTPLTSEEREIITDLANDFYEYLGDQDEFVATDKFLEQIDNDNLMLYDEHFGTLEALWDAELMESVDENHKKIISKLLDMLKQVI